MALIVNLNYLNFKIHEPIGINEALGNPELYATLRKLTVGPSSGMNQALDLYYRDFSQRTINAKVILASSCQKYIGWNLLTHETDNYAFQPRENNVCSHTFVLADFRNCGVGCALIEKAVEIAAPNTVRVYDTGSKSCWFNTIKAKFPRVKSVHAWPGSPNY